MKKIIITSLYLFVCILSLFSQNTNYYTSTKTINGSGFTYKCDLDNTGSVILYNIHNKFTYTEWARKDGKPISDDVLLGYTATVSGGGEVKSRSNKIIREHFTAAEIKMVKGEGLLISMIINSSTGSIDEVCFKFLKRSPLCFIPPARYRALEVALLKNVPKFTVTEEGKKLNYCMMHWNYDF